MKIAVTALGMVLLGFGYDHLSQDCLNCFSAKYVLCLAPTKFETRHERPAKGMWCGKCGHAWTGLIPWKSDVVTLTQSGSQVKLPPVKSPDEYALRAVGIAFQPKHDNR